MFKMKTHNNFTLSQISSIYIKYNLEVLVEENNL